MSETDPHVHVAQKVVEAGADYRSAITSLLGAVPTQPSVVTTGCGHTVPLAMTSSRPESVTCLACRDHAHREYTKLAAQFERLNQPPGLAITGITDDQIADAVKRLQNLAKRFSS